MIKFRKTKFEQILKKMGPENMNTLFVESVREKGSSFYFYLPYNSI